MKRLAVHSKLYWFFVALFLLHQMLQYGFGYTITIADGYLDPFTAPIVLLGAWQFERNWFFGKKAITSRLYLMEIIAMTVYVALVGEFLFPLLSSKFYYDPIDFFAYALGGLCYQITLNKPDDAL